VTGTGDARRPGTRTPGTRAAGRGPVAAPAAPAALARLAAVTALATLATVGRAQGSVGRGAAAPPPPAPTLHEVLAIALRENPDIRVARAHVDSAHGEVRVARAFPNPVTSVVPGIPFQYSATLDLDITPQRVFRVRAARQGQVATADDFADQVRITTFAVRQAFYDELLDEALVDVAGRQRTVLAQILTADSARVRAGDLPDRNLVTSQLELARGDAALAKAQATARAARLALQLLMGVRHPDTAFRVSGTLEYRPVALPMDSLLAIAAASRPDLRSARERTGQSRSIRSFARSLLFPTPNVGVTYQPDQLYPSTPPFAGASHFAFFLSAPVPLFDWFGGEREKAQAGLDVAEITEDRARKQVESDVVTAIDGYRSAETLASRYQGGLLAKAQQAVATAQYAYQRGAISLLDLLDAIRTNGDILVEYYTTVHDFWVSVYTIDEAVGRDLVPD